jgi:hypothetical protein
MTNAEATITENAATVAEQGAHVAPKKASSKKGASQKKVAPKGQKAPKGGKAKVSPKTGAKAGKKATPAPAKEAIAPRAESKGAKIPELIAVSFQIIGLIIVLGKDLPTSLVLTNWRGR